MLGHTQNVVGGCKSAIRPIGPIHPLFKSPIFKVRCLRVLVPRLPRFTWWQKHDFAKRTHFEKFLNPCTSIRNTKTARHFGAKTNPFSLGGSASAHLWLKPVWPVKLSQAPVKRSQAESSPVKQFSGKKRLFIFMRHPLTQPSPKNTTCSSPVGT